MALSKEKIELEIERCKAAIVACEEGIELNRVVAKAFAVELKKCTSTS